MIDTFELPIYSFSLEARYQSLRNTSYDGFKEYVDNVVRVVNQLYNRLRVAVLVKFAYDNKGNISPIGIRSERIYNNPLSEEEDAVLDLCVEFLANYTDFRLVFGNIQGDLDTVEHYMSTIFPEKEEKGVS